MALPPRMVQSTRISKVELVLWFLSINKINNNMKRKLLSYGIFGCVFILGLSFVGSSVFAQMAPTITVSGPSEIRLPNGGAWTVNANDTVAIESLAVDWGDGMSDITIFSSSTSVQAISTHAYTIAGTKTLIFSARNVANMVATTSMNVVIKPANAIPSITDLTFPSSIIIGDTLQFFAFLNDNDDIPEYIGVDISGLSSGRNYTNVTWDNGSSTSVIKDLNLSGGDEYPLQEGVYHVVFRPYQRGPNTLDREYGSSTYRDITVLSNDVPIAGVIGPSVIATGQTSTWTVSSTDQRGGIMSVVILWGDGVTQTVNVSGFPTSVSLPISHQYSTVGYKNIVFKVNDKFGVTTTKTLRIGVGKGYRIQVGFDGVGAGSVVSSSTFENISCPGRDCIKTFPFNAVVTLQAQAINHTSFIGWTDVTCAEGNQSAVCTITVNENKIPRARFDPSSGYRALLVSVSGKGRVVSDMVGIDCGVVNTPKCRAIYPDRYYVYLSAESVKPNSFSGWSGCAVVTNSKCLVTIDNNKTITAVFSSNTTPPKSSSLIESLEAQLNGLTAQLNQLLGR